MLVMVIEQNVFVPAMQLNKIASWHTGYINSVPQTFFFFTINVLSFINSSYNIPAVMSSCLLLGACGLQLFSFFNFFGQATTQRVRLLHLTPDPTGHTGVAVRLPIRSWLKFGQVALYIWGQSPLILLDPRSIASFVLTLSQF